MPIGDIEDQARAQCRQVFPDDERKFKKCVVAQKTILEPEGSVSLEARVIARQTIDNLQTEKTREHYEKEE